MSDATVATVPQNGANAPLRGTDGRAAIAACMALAIAGFATFMGMPLLVGAVIDQFGATEGQGGYLASAEYLGMFAASAIVSNLIRKVDRRLLAAAGIVLAVAGNAASLLFDSIGGLLAVRILSGLGCGTAYGVAVSILAGTQQKVRNFSLLIFSQVFTNAIVVYVFPSLIARWHVAAIFLSYCVILLAASAFIPQLPARPAAPSDHREATVPVGYPPVLPWICLTGVFGFYMMIGAYWAYIERIGVAVGYDEAFVGRMIAAGILLSLLACNAAYYFGQRWGQSRPLLVALGAVAVTHFASSLAFGPAAFLAGLFVVNCFWNFTDIYQIGTISHIDPSGVFAARVQGAQMLAMALSPALAGIYLDSGGSFAGLLSILGAEVTGALAAYLLAYGLMRRQVPHLAEGR